jgi:CRP/FNR family cyclic AMP-dependent transcriptional regulator
MEHSNDAVILARVPWLSPLGAEALDRLARASRRINLARSQTLWRRGESTDAIAVILRGRVDVVRDSDDGKRILLRQIGAGQAVGLSTLSGLAHSADLIAATIASALLIPGNALRDIIRAHPEVAMGALAQLGATISQLSDELEETRFLDLDDRLLRLLRRLGRGLRELQVTHEELGQQVGATRENVSRALKRLERSGAIICGRGRIEFRGG